MPTDRARRPPALRLAARLARREVRRRPGRTALVAVLVALPTAGMLMAAVLIRTEHRTPQEWWQSQYGAADAALSAPADSDAAEMTGELPAGSRVVTHHTDYRLLKTDEKRRAATFVMDVPMEDPIADGLFQVVEGRPARAAGEVFLSQQTAAHLDASVGETLELTRPAPLAVRVVGIGERRISWGSDLAVFGPGTPIPWRAETGGVVHLIVFPDTFDPASLSTTSGGSNGWVDPEVRHHRLELAPRYRIPPTILEGSASTRVAWSWVIGSLVLVVFSIVIASAFAAGARRQLTTVGQLAANGASPSTLRLVLVLQGTWTGLVGVVLGLALGAAALAAAAPHLDRLLARDVDPYSVAAIDIVPIAVLGVLAASAAALLPARSLARAPVLAALAGRRPLAPVPRWLTPTGVALTAAGLGLLALAVLGGTATGGEEVWALTAILGGIGVLVGACTIAPGYVSVLGPVATRLQGGWRLAARSLMRQRTRTGAVVSAVCATAALAVGAASMVLAEQARFADVVPWMPDDQIHVGASTQPDPATGEWSPPQPTDPPAELVAAVDRVVPDAERRQLTVVAPAEAGSMWHILSLQGGDPTGASHAVAGGAGDLLAEDGAKGGDRAILVDAAALAVYDLTETQRDDLRRTGALLLVRLDGQATIGWAGPKAVPAVDGPANAVPDIAPDQQFEAAVHPPPHSDLGSLPRLLVSAKRAVDLNLVGTPGPVVWDAKAPLTAATRAELAELSEDLHAERLDNGFTGADAHLNWMEPMPEVRPALVEGALSGIALLLTMFVIAASLALAAAENKDERDILAILGARPRTLVRASGQKALLLTALGALLALPVGMLPVAVFVGVDDTGLPLVLPWRTIGLLVIGAPIAAWLLTTMFSALAARFRPVRISLMALD